MFSIYIKNLRVIDKIIDIEGAIEEGKKIKKTLPNRRQERDRKETQNKQKLERTKQDSRNLHTSIIEINTRRLNFPEL